MKTSRVTILAVGDMCFADHPLCRGFGVASSVRDFGPDFPFTGIIDFCKSADIVIGNLECALAPPNFQMHGNGGDLPFLGKDQIVEGLSRTGFHLLNMANNHSMQHGRGIFDFTADFLKANGIHPVGLKSKSGLGSQPVIIEDDGCTIGFLGYSFVKEAHHPANLGYAIATPEQTYQEVANLKEQVDQLVVSCHWGLELATLPNPENVEIGRGLVDHGADVVLGHHPHIWQGIERHGKGLIFYSLGDFIFDLLWCKQSRLTGAAIVTLEKGKPPTWRCVPMNLTKYHQPIPMPRKDAEDFHVRLEESSQGIAGLSRGKGNSHYSQRCEVETGRALRNNQVGKLVHVVRNLFRLGLGYLMKMSIKKFLP